MSRHFEASYPCNCSSWMMGGKVLGEIGYGRTQSSRHLVSLSKIKQHSTACQNQWAFQLQVQHGFQHDSSHRNIKEWPEAIDRCGEGRWFGTWDLAGACITDKRLSYSEGETGRDGPWINNYMEIFARPDADCKQVAQLTGRVRVMGRLQLAEDFKRFVGVMSGVGAVSLGSRKPALIKL